MLETRGANADVFGLYELADDGTILYSRPRSEFGLHDAIPDNIGRDFFYDTQHVKNIGDLRRHFRRFITGDQSVDTFLFDCLFDSEIVRAKIFMTRAHETDHDRSGDIVIMDIRRAGQ